MFVNLDIVDIAEAKYILTTAQDITDRVRFEHESNKLNTAFAQSSSSFIITNFNGIIEDVNAKFEETTGYAREEVLGRSPRILKSGIHSPEFYAGLWSTIMSGQTWAGEICNRHKSGELYWEHVVITPVKDENYQITHFFATRIDITKQKKNEAELEKYRKHLEKIVKERTAQLTTINAQLHHTSSKLLDIIDSMPLGYIETTKNGQIIAWNRSTEHIYSIENQIVSKTTLTKLFHFDAHTIEALTTKHGNVKQITVEHFVRNHAITCLWNRIDLTSHKGRTKGTAYIIEDISPLKAAERQLTEALNKEKELNELKSGFVSMTSHQFRTPLTTILSNTEMIGMLFARLPDAEKSTGQKYINRIYDNIERLNLLMSDVLLVGKAQAGKTVFRPHKMLFSEFITGLIADTRDVHQGNRSVQLTIMGTEKPLYADSHLMAHIFNNLLSNAFKYSATNPEIEVHFEDNELNVSVIDYGIGVPPQDQAALFTSFSRGSNTGNIPGTGLGLVIVKEYVEIHSGSISFDTAPGKGTVFTVTLPYKPIENEKNIGD